MELQVGDKLTAQDLLYAMICGGYNDATVALAYAVSPTLFEFVALMNQKASELSMNSTHYANVTGMETESSKTTVSDLFILAKYMAENELFIQICSTPTYKLSESSTCKYAKIVNRSTLLSEYNGLANFNVGSSDFGDCSILHYKTESSTLIAIVMNATSSDTDNKNFAEEFCKELFSFAKENYSLKLVKVKNSIVSSLPVKYSISSKNIDVFLSEEIKVFLENNVDIEKDLEYDVQIFGNEIKAPVKAGDIVGTMSVSYNGQILKTVNLVVKEDIERNIFLYIMDLMKSFIMSIWFLMILVFVLTCIIWIRTHKKRKFRKKKRKKKNKSKKLKK
jgi:D-alanyl-D-alanine carboxypeptidase (penicillin-binding protein 5/6)